MSKVIYKKFRIQKSFVLCFLLIIITALVNHSASATTDVVDRAMIGVPPSCTMRGSGMNSHNAEISNGTVNSAIGETNVNIFCNDDAGYAIYAIGYTDDTDGKTVLTSSSLGSGSDIATSTLTSGGNSQWAMKLSTQTSPTPAYPVTIQNSFDSFHAVPSEYTLVAKRTTGTDVGTNATGSNFKTTYQVYVSSSQLAGTYVGQVKYTLVHPNTTPIPNSTMLDTGQVVAAKMKTLAAGGTTTAYNAKTSDIKAIRMADSLPSGFTPSEANTVSTSTSKHPIYIFFDNTNDASIMYFYTGGYQVVMNPDSASLFRGNLALADISGLEKWDSSNVANMHALFIDSTISLTNLDPLAKWDTSNVENMQGIFSTNPSTFQDGHSSSLSDITALANWDTSNVTNMQQVFSLSTSLTDISALSFWDTSNTTNMAWMFADLPITNVDALSNWDVSNVESMQAMFNIDMWIHDDYGFNSQLEDISGLANWNTGSVTTMSGMFGNSIITNLDSLSGWDVSNVSSMRQMFRDTINLKDASGIKDWDVTGVTATAGSGSSSTNNFYQMFDRSPAIPEPFTLRAGTWNSSGTYVPSS